MPEQTPRFPPNTRVALLPDMEVVYADAVAGQEGWIRDTMFDKHGFERVQVEWDKEHWRYRGVKDVLTYAGHFQLAVEEPIERKPEESDEPTADEDKMVEVAYCQDCGEYHLIEEAVDGRDDRWKAYYETLHRAFEVAGDSGNFVLLTMAPLPDDPNETIVPHLYSDNVENTVDPLLYVQMGAIAQQALKAWALERRSDGRTSSDVPTDGH